MNEQSKPRLKVLHAPVNYANQAYLMSQALKGIGIDAMQMRYRFPNEGVQYYDDDETVVSLSRQDWYGDMLRNVQDVAAQGYDIIHFWNRTFLHWRPGDIINGTDLPFLRLAGAKLAFRFTGYDLRRKSLELKLNRFSPYNYGYESPYNEDDQRRYLDSITPYIDEFVVQDPEMRSYFPGARVLPRALDLNDFTVPGEEPNARPLVVHAPSKRALKGTEFVLKAVEQLKSESLDFDFQLVENLANADALALYRRSDIVIDQILIGWYGVLAMEAMAMGKAAVAYIREDLLGYFRNGMPLLTANPENITEVLRTAIKDKELRSEIGRRARHFVEQVHDSRKVAYEAAKMYQQMLESPAQPIMPDFSFQLAKSAEFRARIDDSAVREAQARITELEQQVQAYAERSTQRSGEFAAIGLTNENLAKENARIQKLEAENAALKSALSESVYEKSRCEALEDELSTLREELNALRNHLP